MSTSPPYHHGDLREALLDEATKIAAEGVSSGLTLRAVARNVGVSHAAAYRHFSSKNDLLGALALRGFDELAASIAPVHRDPSTTVADAAGLYVDFARRRPVEFRLMFDKSLCLTGASADELAGAGRRAQEALTEFLAARYDIPADQLAAASFAAWSQMHGAAVLLLETPALADLDTQSAQWLVRAASAHLDFTREPRVR